MSPTQNLSSAPLHSTAEQVEGRNETGNERRVLLLLLLLLRLGIVIYASGGGGGGEKTSECIFRLTEPRSLARSSSSSSSFRFLLVIRLFRRFSLSGWGGGGRTYRVGMDQGGEERRGEERKEKELNGEMSGDVVCGGVVPVLVVVAVAEGKECNYTPSFRPFFTEKAIQRVKKKINKGLPHFLRRQTRRNR